MFCVRVTAYCASTLLCSLSELLPVVRAHLSSVSGLLPSFPAPCPVLCQSYCLLIQHTAAFYVIYSLVFSTVVLHVRVTPSCSSPLPCCMSELLPSVPAHLCTLSGLLPIVPAYCYVLCQSCSPLVQHTAVFCVRVTA